MTRISIFDKEEIKAYINFIETCPSPIFFPPNWAKGWKSHFEIELEAYTQIKKTKELLAKLKEEEE